MARWCWISLLLLACAGLLEATETPVDFESVRAAAVYRPLPEMHRFSDASCTFHLAVDPATGRVTNVSLVKTSGDSHLTYHLAEALRTWKFKPGTPGLIRVSFGTTENWGRLRRGDERHAASMDDVLAPFLGKGALVRGELPEYPTKPAWTNKHGTGAYELHLDEKGHVSEVTIKRSSGDGVFDEITVNALRRWRFRRKGPLIIELPLSFALTKTKFSIRVPRNS